MLKDQVIVVTGGAGFLGRSFARSIAEHGGIAIVADLDKNRARQIAKRIEAKFPRRAYAASVDITEKNSVVALIKHLHDEHGRIDAVVNNAYPRNRHYGRKLELIEYNDFCENINSHLGGYFLIAQQFCLYFRKQGGGRVINMASIYGTLPPRFNIYNGTSMTMPVEYAAIKAGVIHLTRYFAQYFKSENIRVNSLSPGGLLQGQPETFLREYSRYCGTKGMLAPSDICGTLLFLLSGASRFVTGQNIVVDDGFSL